MAEPLPDGWTENLDPGSGNKFYHHATTGETSWERPRPVAAAAGALPAGWTENVDPGSGNKFYHNAATGETSWERPESTPAAAAAGALPEGWAEHSDPGSGQVFYYNAATGVTSWERPQSTPAAAAASAPDGLPEGWSEHLDPGSGRTFYSKAATGETAWEKPVATPAATGTWSTAQAHNLGSDPRLDLLQNRGIEILSTKQGGVWSSVSRVVDALNDGSLVVGFGLCVLFSASKDSYWLLWRSDKEKDSESIIATC